MPPLLPVEVVLARHDVAAGRRVVVRRIDPFQQDAVHAFARPDERLARDERGNRL